MHGDDIGELSKGRLPETQIGAHYPRVPKGVIPAQGWVLPLDAAVFVCGAGHEVSVDYLYRGS